MRPIQNAAIRASSIKLRSIQGMHVLGRVINNLRATARKRAQARYARTFDVCAFDDPLPCLWSKGISRVCDVRGPEWYWHAATESVQPAGFFREHYSGSAGLVWVRLGTRARDGLTTDLDQFASEALPSIRRSFVLVTSDGDSSVPRDLNPATVEALLSSPWLVAWYSQNAVAADIEKIKQLPIGLDLHTPRAACGPGYLLQQLKELRNQRTDAAKMVPRAFCDLGLSLASAERIAAVHALRGCRLIAMQEKRVSQTAIWQRYAAYPFVLSTEGNGLDCHRTWEALYLGSIVITRHSPLDRMFADLPVVIVKDWEEVCNEANLRGWQRTFAPLTAADNVWSALAPSAYEALMRRHLDLSSRDHSQG